MTAEHCAKMIAALVLLVTLGTKAQEPANPAAATISFAKKTVNSAFSHEQLEIAPPIPPVVVPVKLTAYHSQNCISNPRRGLTATGESACNKNGVAADWQLLPPGTKLFIPGVGARTVDDTGTEMRRVGKHGVYHLDVRMLTFKEACHFGAKWTYAQLM